MTAGRGILHQEMPEAMRQEGCTGFSYGSTCRHRLAMTAPRYQDVLSKDVPEVIDDDGTTARILCGDFGENEAW